MQILKTTLLFVLILNIGTTLLAQGSNQVIEKVDIDNLIGEWTGTLTYIDYNSNKPYSMPCELSVTPKRKYRKLKRYYTYPNEPKANSKGKFKFSKDRSKIGGKRIVSRTKNVDGDAEIITEYTGKDGNDNKKALIRNIYTIGSNTFIITKKVQFEGSTEWIKRNEYHFKRKK